MIDMFTQFCVCWRNWLQGQLFFQLWNPEIPLKLPLQTKLADFLLISTQWLVRLFKASCHGRHGHPNVASIGGIRPKCPLQNQNDWLPVEFGASLLRLLSCHDGHVHWYLCQTVHQWNWCQGLQFFSLSNIFQCFPPSDLFGMFFGKPKIHPFSPQTFSKIHLSVK